MSASPSAQAAILAMLAGLLAGAPTVVLAQAGVPRNEPDGTVPRALIPNLVPDVDRRDVPEPPAPQDADAELNRAEPTDQPDPADEEVTPPAEPDEGQLAGLPVGTPCQALSLEQAYRLALIASREDEAGRDPDPEALLDPATRDELAQRHAVGDWDRFRREFRAARSPDPVAGFLEALGRRQALVGAHREVALTEPLLEAYRQMAEGEGANFSQRDVDAVALRLEAAWASVIEAAAEYQARLERWRIDLGLRPDAPVIPDPSLLAPFEATFQGADDWLAHEDRDSATADDLAAELPRPPTMEPAVEGQDEAAILRELVGLARATPPAPGNDPAETRATRMARELRIREEVRQLRKSGDLYERERVRWALTLHRVDHLASILFLPPSAATPSDPKKVVAELTEARRGESAIRVRLVRYWLAAQAHRVAIARESGLLPYDDWDGYLRSFHPVPTAPAPEGLRRAQPRAAGPQPERSEPPERLPLPPTPSSEVEGAPPPLPPPPSESTQG